MTTRIPTTAWELATVALWTAPWSILLRAARRGECHRQTVVLWFGGIAALLFLYYFDHYTSLSLVTKAAMPPIALGVGLIPHFIRKMGFFSSCHHLQQEWRGPLFYITLPFTLFTPTAHFATKVIGVLLVTFCLSAITSGVLAVLTYYCRQMSRRSAT